MVSRMLEGTDRDGLGRVETPGIPGRRALGLLRPRGRRADAPAIGPGAPRVVDDQERNGVVRWPEWGRRKLTDARAGCARLINAHPDEIAFIANTTQGIGLIAEGYPWKPGDSVVTASEEYPSNLYPWMNLKDRGVTLRTVPTRPDGRIWVDDLAAAIDSTTRVLTISHVEFASGFRNDLDALGELCRVARDRLFRRRDPGAWPSDDRRSEDSDRFPRRRRPQVAARSRGGGLCSTSAASGSSGSGRSESAGKA